MRNISHQFLDQLSRKCILQVQHLCNLYMRNYQLIILFQSQLQQLYKQHKKFQQLFRKYLHIYLQHIQQLYLLYIQYNLRYSLCMYYYHLSNVLQLLRFYMQYVWLLSQHKSQLQNHCINYILYSKIRNHLSKWNIIQLLQYKHHNCRYILHKQQQITYNYQHKLYKLQMSYILNSYQSIFHTFYLQERILFYICYNRLLQQYILHNQLYRYIRNIHQQL